MSSSLSRLYFIHIPKTAGTTIIDVLDRYFHRDEIFPAQLWRELVEIPQETIKDYRLYRGHFGGGGLRPFLPEPPACMTMLRHPFPAAFSTFRFIQAEPETRAHRIAKGRDFAQFLEHPQTRARVSNKQVRQLSFDLEHDPDAGPIFWSPASLAAVDRWIHDRRVAVSPQQRLQRAKSKLEECVFFGLVERFPEALALLAYTFAWPSIGQPQSRRVVNARWTESELSAHERAVLEQCNEQDLELYAFAERLFDARLAAMISDLKPHDRKGAIRDGRIVDGEALAGILDRRYAAQLSATREAGAKSTFDFAGPLFGTGWQRRELTPADGSIFRWTGPEPVATLHLRAPRHDDLRMTVHIVNAIELRSLERIEVTANDQPIPLEVVRGEGSVCRTLQGVVPRDCFAPDRMAIRLQVRLDHVASPQATVPAHPDERLLGVAVNWIDLRPTEVLPAGEIPDVELRTYPLPARAPLGLRHAPRPVAMVHGLIRLGKRLVDRQHARLRSLRSGRSFGS